MNRVRRNCGMLGGILLSTGLAFATTPSIVVNSPTDNASLTSAVHYQAAATSSQCSQGLAAMQVYSGPGVLVYGTSGGIVDTYISLTPGTYNTTIQAWDLCGGYAKANVTITVTSLNPIDGYLYIARANRLCFGSPSCAGTGTPQGYVQGYVISSEGSLTAIAQGTVKANQLTWSIAGDIGGYRLYAGDYLSGDIFAYFIDRRYGYLYPVPGSPFPVNHSVTAVAVHPSGQFVFALRNENAPGDGLAMFRVNSDGSLSEVAGSPVSTQTDPWSVVVDPSGKYVYVASLIADTIDAFAIDEVNGALTPLPGSPFKIPVPANCTGAWPHNILDLGGNYIYTADQVSDAIAGFDISSAGTLSDMPGSPFVPFGGCGMGFSGFSPRYLAIDGLGNYLYALGSLNASSDLSLSIYSIDASGGLTYLKNIPALSPGAICEGPISTDATGNYLYGVACGSPGAPEPALAGFRINHDTGDLTPVPGSPFITDPAYYNLSILGIATTP